MLKCASRLMLMIFLTVVSTAHARAPKEYSPDAIFKLYKDAVVRIEVTLHGASLGVGSGFFITNKGEIATSLHVVRPFLVHPEADIKVKLANGKVFTNVTFGACSDARGIDLCLLKIDTVPKSILAPGPADVTPGESIVAIGHPRGLDFSISTGIVSAVRTHSSGWNEVQIDAAISPGNSGGPIINREGQAIGVVYQFERDGQNLNFGIMVPEVERLRDMKLPFLAVNEARKDFSDRSKRLARRVADRWVKPAIQSFSAQTPDAIKARPTGLKWMRAQLGTTSFLMMLPDLFQNCEKAEADAETSSTACSSAGGDLVITIQKRPRSLEGSLAAYRGRKLVEARPLAIVDRLEADGSWEQSKAKKSAFISRPSVSRCYPLTKKNIASSDETSQITLRKQGFFQNATALCRFETENDSEPGAISASQWIDVGADFYGVNVWAADPGRLALLQGLSDLVLVSAGTSSDDLRVPYRAKLRPGLKRDAAPAAPAIVGADISDSYSDDISNVVITHTSAVAPSQMNRAFMKWASAVSKSSAPKPSDVASLEIARSPGRTGSWVIPHPTDRRRNALFMMSASFGASDTWVIYEIQPLPLSQPVNRAPSKSIATDVDRFRSWTQEFEPLKTPSQD